MTATVTERLEETGMVLPPVSRPSGSYVPAVASGNLLFASGQVPRVDGVVKYKGKVGEDCSLQDAYEGARICALNCLAAISQAAGGLDNVARILKVNGYINAAPGFTQNPKVLDGASDVLTEVFGNAGCHARSAIGVQALPDHAAVEVEMIVLLREPRDYPFVGGDTVS